MMLYREYPDFAFPNPLWPKGGVGQNLTALISKASTKESLPLNSSPRGFVSDSGVTGFKCPRTYARETNTYWQ
jgi:hypothetical protein